MVAYVVWDDVVAGSNPVTPNPLTKVIDKHIYHASLVQLVERRSPKPDVVGSSPTGRVEKIGGSQIGHFPCKMEDK